MKFRLYWPYTRLSKGQIILKGLFGVLEFSQITNKRIRRSSKNEFVFLFLERIQGYRKSLRNHLTFITFWIREEEKIVAGENRIRTHHSAYFLVLYFFCIKAAGINRESIRKTVVHPTRKKYTTITYLCIFFLNSLWQIFWLICICKLQFNDTLLLFIFRKKIFLS